ncbi:hypothetical protein DTO164E3_3519 [Paecilomyces variotii]|nr:hypothetical protein DTO164E3_3519 [Paecilomyces variotii]KAJ9204788.1 hypothetical protein DTO032I3_2533 [Paecilomyces variotii]KAJ9219683.1 hypothetical protein DTO169C6_7955 [Paecilomyces variotii]KAJ9268150.1 hypothetical protein DTO212C5_5838 [Paecilomyces variotii]KAJ9279846.1 hypothetical protein DTO021D3_3351 [Paecilomyces variotii]
MGRNMLKLLFVAPEVNPINQKALSIPVLNPFNRYGRAFFFSWLGFMTAFLSWYAFPPLLTDTIKGDLHMSQNQVANSNIIALLATLIVRFISGPLCDRFGPRLVFIGLLLAGAIPTAMAGLVTNPNGLIALRFFVGILGGTFVPCQVWTTGFFDKSIVGFANSLAGGLGNAGGGITYFVMPAVFDSLVHQRGLAPHKAWRVAYIVPFIIITAIALCMLFLCEDTPTGKWSERHKWMEQQHPDNTPAEQEIVDTKSGVRSNDLSSPASESSSVIEKKSPRPQDAMADQEAQTAEGDSTYAEVVVAPTTKEALRVIFSLATLSVATAYACSFGAELAIESILGSYYGHNFPHLGQTETGRWAAMFGLLNVVFRPIGGYISDLIYRSTNNVWGKKMWLTFLGVIMGAFQLAIGLTNPRSQSAMFGLSAGLAFFLEACNGANFALVPHVHPYANGIVSGIVGATGNLGGIIFAIIFRYNGVQYGRSIWIIGAISIGIFVTLSWVRPVPKGQSSHR